MEAELYKYGRESHDVRINVGKIHFKTDDLNQAQCISDQKDPKP